MIFGGVWLSDDGASDACRARLRLRRWQFGGDLEFVAGASRAETCAELTEPGKLMGTSS